MYSKWRTDYNTGKFGPLVSSGGRTGGGPTWRPSVGNVQGSLQSMEDLQALMRGTFRSSRDVVLRQTRGRTRPPLVKGGRYGSSFDARRNFVRLAKWKALRELLEALGYEGEADAAFVRTQKRLGFTFDGEKAPEFGCGGFFDKYSTYISGPDFPYPSGCFAASGMWDSFEEAAPSVALGGFVVSTWSQNPLFETGAAHEVWKRTGTGTGKQIVLMLKGNPEPWVQPDGQFDTAPRKRTRVRLKPYQELAYETVVKTLPSGRMERQGPPRPVAVDHMPTKKGDEKWFLRQSAAAKLYGALTEVIDAVECIENNQIHDPHGRNKAYAPGTFDAWTGHLVGRPFHDRLFNAGQLVLGGAVDWPAALRCMAVSQLSDKAIGKLNRARLDALKSTGYWRSPVGPGFGPGV